MKIIDAGVLIGSLRQHDEYHREAESLLSRHGDASTTDWIIAEVVEFIRRKDGCKSAALAGRRLLGLGIEIIRPELPDLSEALGIMEKYGNLSFVDASTVAALSLFEEKSVLSFDSGFDRVKGIKRIF